MGLDKLIDIAKGNAEEKIGLSIKIPTYLKNQLTEMTSKNNITVNGFLVALIDDVLNGDLKDRSNLEVVQEMQKLIKQQRELEKAKFDNNNERFLLLENGDELDLEEEMYRVEHMIRLLKRVS